MGSAASMLAEARRSLGLAGRPNYITRDYASRHGNEFLAVAWCDMAVTYWARRSGNARAVLPSGDRAYTVWHAGDFQKIDRWYSGTAANIDRAKPGDIVFFDWGGSNSTGAIDHIGVIEKALDGGRVQTIEGNTDDAVKRRVRSHTVIAGFGRPDYSNQEDDVPLTKDEIQKIAAATAKAVWETDGLIAAPPNKVAEGNTHWAPESYTYWGYQQGSQILGLLAQMAKETPDVDEDAIAAAVLATLTPERIAEAIPADIGEQVMDAMAARLAPGTWSWPPRA